MKRSGRPLSALASVMTVYPQITVNITADADQKLKFFTDPKIKSVIKDASLKLSPDGRLLVRPSGTEPLIRVMAEGKDQALINETVRSVSALLRAALSSD